MHALQYITLHNESHYTALHRRALHCIALHCPTLHVIALCYIALHYIHRCIYAVQRCKEMQRCKTCNSYFLSYNNWTSLSVLHSMFYWQRPRDCRDYVDIGWPRCFVPASSLDFNLRILLSDQLYIPSFKLLRNYGVFK